MRRLLKTTKWPKTLGNRLIKKRQKNVKLLKDNYVKNFLLFNFVLFSYRQELFLRTNVSNIELLTKIASGFKPFIIFAKSSILESEFWIRLCIYWEVNVSSSKEIRWKTCTSIVMVLQHQNITHTLTIKLKYKKPLQMIFWKIHQYRHTDQSWTKYLIQAQVFMGNSTLRVKLNFYFSVFC